MVEFMSLGCWEHSPLKQRSLSASSFVHGFIPVTFWLTCVQAVQQAKSSPPCSGWSGSSNQRQLETLFIRCSIGQLNLLSVKTGCLDMPMLWYIFCAWQRGFFTVGFVLLFFLAMKESECECIPVTFQVQQLGFLCLPRQCWRLFFSPWRGDALSLYSCRCGLVFRYSRHFSARLGTATKLYVQGLYHCDHVGSSPCLPCGKS